MSTKRRSGDTSAPLIVSLALLPLLCCGLPALIATGVFGVLASWLINRWVIAVAVLAVAGVVVSIARRHYAVIHRGCRQPRDQER